MRLVAIMAAASFLAVAYGQAAAAAKKKTAPKSSAKAAVSSKVVSSKKAISKKGAAKQIVRRPPLQQQPTAERYREIQQALAEKGYFSGPVDGAWGPESVESLKRFQKDQNLDVDGKIGALSLMALGLGPKRGPASAQAADAAVDPPPVAQPRP